MLLKNSACLVLLALFIFPLSSHAQHGPSNGDDVSQTVPSSAIMSDDEMKAFEAKIDASAKADLQNIKSPNLNISSASAYSDNSGSSSVDTNASTPCQQAARTNISACGDPNSAAGMSGGESAQMSAGLGMVAMMGAQAAAASGSAKACMMANTLNMALQGMGLIKSMACRRTITSCQKVCNADARTESDAAKASELGSAEHLKIAHGDTANASMCGGNSAKANAMTTQVMMLGMSAMNSLNCKSQTSDSASSLAAVATATPAALTSTTLDCSNQSYAATSTACICAANPTNALCGGSSLGTGAGSVGGVAAGGVTTPGITTGTNDEGNLVGAAAEGKSQNGTLGSSGGGSGGGAGGGGSGGLNPDGSAGGGDGSGINKDVITGASGGSGSGLAAGGGSGGGGAGGGLGKAAGGGGASGGFDMSKYLPKNMFKNRGLAGMTVPAKDGVTGPLGPSIWEKVHTRYEDKKSSLIQEK